MSAVGPAGAAAPRRARALGLLSGTALAALIAVAWWPTFSWLQQRYTAPDSFYGHGPLVPLVTLFLLWRRRARLRAAAGGGHRGGSWGALLPVAFALLLHLVATFLRIDFLSGLGLVLLIPGLVWLLCGREVLRVAAFPLAFLAFAVPLPMVLVLRVVLALKEAVLSASAAVLNACGAGITVEGSFLLLPGGGRLLVEEECCGLRSLIALVALGVLMAGTARGLRMRERVALVLLAGPLALLANLVRVVLLAGVGIAFGVSAAHRFHDPSSYAVYVVALGAYLGLEWWWTGRRSKAAGGKP